MRTPLQRSGRHTKRMPFGRHEPPVRLRNDVRTAGMAGGGLLLAVLAGFLLGFFPAARRYLRMKKM